MSRRTKRLSWALWGLCSLAAGAALADRLIGESRSRELFLPGKTTDGHYQIELDCGACHTSTFTSKDELQTACVGCHGAELEVAKDSHPTTKFTDPRNAERIAVLDGRYCVTCHAEHRPERTGTMGLSLPGDYCYHCHQDIAEERATHVGLAFDSCATSGCHNFHDNRALYEDYLVLHGEQPWLVPPVPPVADEPRAATPTHALTEADADGPGSASAHVASWARSAHALGGVNCSGCHEATGGKWRSEVAVEVCGRCHQSAADGWLSGKHGMRVAAGLGPMLVSEARRPMKGAAHAEELSCASCHGDHGTDTERAGLEACEGCHDDQHTRAYRLSKHFELVLAERDGRVAEGSGVTCATCHLPVMVDEAGHKRVQHNQNDNLRPSEKMIRTACQGCHGLPFTIDALADVDLVRRNFRGTPSKHVSSVDFARSRAE